jgi:putative solute:sodium symporter small subunit|tara:strand:- start:1200 stop:1457 length:258 start_codon:yes stop_codon:yes gene_type:complete
MKINNSQKYWRANLGIVFLLLLFWFLSSFGAGILFSDYLDKIRIGGFNLGFWFAQQGSIIVFVFLIIIYCILMNKLDEKFNKEKN